MGLRLHRIAKHNILPEAALIVPPKAPEPQAVVLAQTRPIEQPRSQAVEQKAVEAPQEAKRTMEQQSKEQNAQDCPECRRRDFKIVDLEHELANLQKTNSTLEQKLNNAEERAYEIPDLSTVIQHCESGECTAHAKQWDQIKARIVQNAYDNLPPEAISDKVVEAEGLKRGFIPKKIILPGRFVQNG